MVWTTSSRALAVMVGCLALLSAPATAEHHHHQHRRQHHHAGYSVGPPIWQTRPGAESVTTITIGATTSIQSVIPSATVASASASASAAAAAASSSASASVSALKAQVIIPFYVYPDPGKWTPLLELITSFPDVHFTVIINPSSGPGTSALPDAAFLTAIPSLTQHSNVLAIGYVPTQKGTRALSAVENDINIYANWPTAADNSSFAVHGIFLDEAPNAYSAELVAYYTSCAELIRSKSGLGPENYVVTNPGTPPDSAYLAIADSTVVFESPYASFQDALAAGTFNKLNTTGSTHSKMASMVYGVPDSVHLPTLLAQVGNFSEQIFLGNTSSYMVYDTYMNSVVPALLEMV
ncbi:spherulation-specific family 4 protein [Aspergillus saccharolyticus JOP 1030-1]|uniref:Spherulin 4-like cell surface protein n=1 Tax=Aspergillus saccharolyticus JOP 1030-1 TaxID=1450539 RepID=A0A318ZDP8_9EURO|nr:hypothetical protein BP01DRAFT_320565 [Aspergillus saccharolyticus JOP 1030-1]PYH44707.1 hypothetical protein BP01DRAFT_320565 [Aspergillus saccharolyticus JOP 1030-1]